jgi:putative hydrolase of the HAD superfamily
VVLLDFWGVIGVVQTPQSVAGMAARIGAPVTDFSEAYWRFREEHDAGGSASAFWAQVAADLEVDLDESTVADLIELDVQSWSGVHPDMLDLIRDLRDAGCRLALLSNAPADLVQHASEVLAGLVPESLFSSQLGIAKPDPQAYLLAARSLGVGTGEIVFIDDNEANVHAARGVGMRAIQHESVPQTRAMLADLLGVTIP